MKIPPRATVLLFLAMSLALVASRAAPTLESAEIQAALERHVLDPETTWREAGKFCDDRVPLMPSVTTAAAWTRVAEQLRRDLLERVVFRGDLARQWRNAPTSVIWGATLAGGPGYRIRKLRYEALPGMWIPALLYEPDARAQKAPVHLALSGHTGTGKAAPASQVRCINLAKRGIVSLVPDWFSFGQLRSDPGDNSTTVERGPEEGFKHAAMNQLDLCGVSGLAPHYLALSRGLDLLLALPQADPARVVVSGYSGGGWQTILISALDTRVTACNAVAGFASFRTWVSARGMIGDSEQSPNDFATVADYTHLTAMLAGRSALLTYNARDNCCFIAEHALPPLLEATEPIFQLFPNVAALRSHINYDPGTHNYERDNREAFYRALGEWSFAGEDWNAAEIACSNEIKTPEELQVSLPRENIGFNQLARSAMADLPRDPDFSQRDPSAARARLRKILHWRASRFEANVVGAQNFPFRFWRLQIDRDWTVPVVEFTPNRPTGTTVVLADGGHRTVGREVERLLRAGRRVLAVDVYGFGEARITPGAGRKDYALLMAAVGERSLGVQSSQLVAIARWAAQTFQNSPVSVGAFGPRTSLIALATAALERDASVRLELHDAMTSLKELIERNVGANERPEQFCFGLLESFDIPQLDALARNWP